MANAVRPPGGGLSALDVETRTVLAQGVSLALHLGLLAAAALSWPQLGTTDEATTSVMATHVVFHVMPGIAEQEVEAPTTPYFEGGSARLDEGGVAQAESADGKAGSSTSQTAAGAIARQGPEDNLDPAPARRGWEDPSACWCFAPLLKEPTGDRDGLEVNHEAIGSDPQQAIGNLQSLAPAEAAGRGGSALTGSGQGGRALACVGRRSGRGIGAGSVRHGGGTGTASPGAPGPPTNKRWNSSGVRGVTSTPSPHAQDLDCDDSPPR